MKTRERIDPGQLDIKDTVVSINRVTKVVKGGKNLSFSALVVVGDGHGVVGFGIGKAKEVPSRSRRVSVGEGTSSVVRWWHTTIPHAIVGNFGAGGCCWPGAKRHHYRRRCGSRGGRGGRDYEHPDESLGPRIRKWRGRQLPGSIR
jgi:ribosomal protein S5